MIKRCYCVCLYIICFNSKMNINKNIDFILYMRLCICSVYHMFQFKRWYKQKHWFYFIDRRILFYSFKTSIIEPVKLKKEITFTNSKCNHIMIHPWLIQSFQALELWSFHGKLQYLPELLLTSTINRILSFIARFFLLNI